MNIINIGGQQAGSIALSGGKGASLAKLIHMPGINVPAGVILTTDFFKAYISPAISAAAKDDVKQAVASMSLPVDAQTQILSAYAGIGADVPVAVRSSATAEDLPDASFAGQQDTYLNVTGPQALIQAITDCFASLYNERAVSYREKNGIPEDQVQMAVVIQKMVNAKTAGVMFTADPMTSDRLTLTIDAVEGLGEELVSGRKIPAAFSVKHDRIERKNKADILTDSQVKQLAAIGRAIEKEYGCPQDIEWALENDTFYVVQSRAITTLYPCPPSKDGFKRCYISIGHIQMMTDTLTPLGMSFWKKMTDDVDFVNDGGRMYMEVTHNMTGPVGRALLKQKTANSDELMDDALKQVLARKDYIKSIPKGKASNFSMPSTLLPAAVAGMRIYYRNNPADIEGYERRMEENIAKAKTELSKLSGKEAMEFIRADMRDLMKSLTDPEGMGPLVIAYFLTKPIDKAGKELLGRDGISGVLAKWLRVNITSAMGMCVSRIADAARAYPEVVKYLETAGDSFQTDELRKLPGGEQTAKEFETFFARYGMRCPGEIDISKPRFIEAPSKIISAVLADVKLPKGDTQQRFAQGKKESDAAVDELVAAAKEKWGDRKAKKFSKRLSFYRNFLGLRESPKYYWMKRYWVYKRAIVRETQNLAASGALRHTDDAYYLSLDELIDLFGGNFTPDYAKIDAMRADYKHWETLAPPRLIFSDGEVVEGRYKRDVPEGALPGLAVSGGVAEGRARVILDIKDAGRIEKGDILVTKYTDPSWTPAFMSIGALVTEIGGMATHGAVVTREYGLPAVVGVTDATNRINDGDLIRVNGDLGYIERLA